MVYCRQLPFDRGRHLRTEEGHYVRDLLRERRRPRAVALWPRGLLRWLRAQTAEVPPLLPAVPRMPGKARRRCEGVFGYTHRNRRTGSRSCSGWPRSPVAREFSPVAREVSHRCTQLCAPIPRGSVTLLLLSQESLMILSELHFR